MFENATQISLIIGAVCGLVPLGVSLRYGLWLPGLMGFVLCTLSGFACGLLGGLPMILLTCAVVISYAYVDKQDPFTSRAKLEDVSFDETPFEYFMRQMAAFGQMVRASAWALFRNKAGFIGFLGLLFFFCMTVFGPLFIEYDSDTHIERRQPGSFTLFQPPSSEYPLGLDFKGRDVLSHVVYGGRSLMVTAVQAGILTTLVAVALGAIAGLQGGWLDQIFSTAANFILTLPQFPLLLVLATLLKFNNQFYLALLLATLNWPTLMRAVRAQVLSLREREYVQAAYALDLGLFHIITREVMPNMISYIVVNMIFSIRAAMYSIVALVFLGMVPLVEPDWGVMIYTGRQQGALFNSDAISMVLAPVLAIALFQLSLVLFTRSLEEIFNPRLRQSL